MSEVDTFPSDAAVFILRISTLDGNAIRKTSRTECDTEDLVRLAQDREPWRIMTT